MRVFGISLLLIVLTGCISTQVKDFTDPDFQTFTARKLLVGTPSMEFDQNFLQVAKEYNLDVTLVAMHQIFPITRQYTPEQKIKTIREQGFDSYLAVNVTGDTGDQRHVVGYTSQSNATAYGSGNYAYASGTGTTTPVVSASRKTLSRATLHDVATEKTVWLADLDTSAKGTIYTQSDDAMEEIAETVIESLIKAGHLKVKPAPKETKQQ